MIDSPLPSVSAWVRALADAEIPILPHALAELEQLREIEDTRGTVDARTLADAMGANPLMVLKVLTHVSRYCTRLGVEPPETLTGAIVMMGIAPFFNTFLNAPTFIEWFKSDPDAASGLLKVITRARRAANFSLNFAIRRQDEDAAILYEAALLHDFAEMLLWCHAPKLAKEIHRLKRADPALRSSAAQKAVLGTTLNALAHGLMREWQLPDMLIKCTDERRVNDPQVRNVMLAVRLARHSRNGWDAPNAQPALRDDIAGVAQLLTLSEEAATRLVMTLDD